MRILAKIVKNKEIYEKVFLDLLKVGSISSFYIEGKAYYSFTPFQAVALQKVGVGLEFYRSNKELYPQAPIVPQGTKVKKVKLTTKVEEPEELEKFVSKLEKKLDS